MATVVETEAKLDTSNFEEGIEKMKEGMEEAAETAGETSEGTKKDWGAIGGLFQDFLPRGLQRTIRSFQMTQRSVGRAATFIENLSYYFKLSNSSASLHTFARMRGCVGVCRNAATRTATEPGTARPRDP